MQASVDGIADSLVAVTQDEEKEYVSNNEGEGKLQFLLGTVSRPALYVLSVQCM